MTLSAILLGASLAACGSSSGGTGSAGSSSSGGSSDSMLEAWPVAQAAMHKVVGDALLMSAGTTGLAFADVPDTWSYSFYSPAKNHIYTVSVEGATAQPPRDLGPVRAGVTVKPVTDIGAIKVGAAGAVVKARAFGEKAGSVPRNVMVVGSFADLPGSGVVGMKTGVWAVTFASDTSASDAKVFYVDMITGAVSAAKK
jgi:hypothetical protein